MVETKIVEEFVQKVIKLSKEMNVSIGHEDVQGAFLFVEYNDNNTEWLLESIKFHESKQQRRNLMYLVQTCVS